MIAPFYFKKFGNKILMTNDTGQYVFLQESDFFLFMNNEIRTSSELYSELKNKYFLFDSSEEYFIELMKDKLRSGKQYIFSSTSLHIFVVTNFCNGKCVYCQAQSNPENKYEKMSIKTAQNAVDVALQSPSNRLSFEFQGGEPLSNFEIIKFIIEYTEKNKLNKVVDYSVVSNLTLFKEEMLSFFEKYNVTVSTSLDGNSILHNTNRPMQNKCDSHALVKKYINRIKDRGIPCGALQTTTRQSLNQAESIIEEYVSLGLNNIFIRPLTPLGEALSKWDLIGYSVDEFLVFYKRCLTYILEKNKQGVFIKEGHASIFLSKILSGYGQNYMELRSPCGAGIGQIAYYHNGDVYTCDEGRMLAEMGDESFKLGNVFVDDYNSLMESSVCKTVCKYSILEGLTSCSECVYLPYCGTCPVVNFALENDIISKSDNNYRCGIYKGMLDIIFGLLTEPENERIMQEWV